MIRGDCRDPRNLEDAGVRNARGVLVATSVDLVNLSCALMVRRIAPEVRVVLRMFNQNLIARLSKAIPNITALSVSALSAPTLALTATTGDVLATFLIGSNRWQVAETTLNDNSIRIGKPIGSLDESNRLSILAHEPRGQATRLLQDMDVQTKSAVGDRYIVAGESKSVRRFVDPSRADDQEVHWAGRVRRTWRVARRTFGEMDLPVKIGTIAMLVAVIASMAVYRFGLGHGWADGLYRTISVIATGSELGGTEYEGWGKVFVSVLRILGTVLVAAFTALLTNYLIRAKLGGAFEVRRIPERGHVALIGLGNVGLRVVEELMRLGEPVVAIEWKKDNPFIASCRRMRVPVIVGDATIAEILTQARVAEARAVIAATSNDLVNLEVALLVAELNGRQRVVVRVSDPALAETSRLAAGVKMAISLPELAAPAFVAALIGDRVLAMYPVGLQMLSVSEIAVQANDRQLMDHSLFALAIDYRFTPLSVLGSDGRERPPDTTYRLREGDRLVVVARLSDLERIIQRAPVEHNCTVEISGFPLPAREPLAMRLRALRGFDQKQTDEIVSRTPFVIAERQSRGEAAELVAAFRRDKIECRVLPS